MFAETTPLEPHTDAAGTPGAVTSQTDPQVAVSFGHETYLVRDNKSINVIVILSADPERDLVIPITANNRDGASDAD